MVKLEKNFEYVDPELIKKITKKISKKISRQKRKYERTHITFKEEPKITY